MNYLQECSFKEMIVPVDANGTTATAVALDTTGPSGFNRYFYATILFVIGNIAADMTALKLTECDTSGGSYVDITGGDFSVAATGTLPTAAGGDNKIWVWQVNLLPRKKFLKVTATAGAAATLCTAVAILSRGTNFPVDNTERNVGGYAVI